ncbi:MAG: hypothetical protein H7Z21_14695 [Hymenobacter sp.]|nr:hypothetical protein [Hymenobacter sp.]
MKKHRLLLPLAAALTLASCNNNKTTETATAEEAMAGPDNVAVVYRNRANIIADKMAADMNITDTALVSRIRTTYYNRATRLGELRTQYTTDTAGMAAAMRGAYSETDNELKGYLPAESYTAYESSRPTYYEEAYTDDSAAPTDMGNMDSPASAPAETGSMSDGEGKLKVKADGDVKIKDAAGNKAKIDGDDGTVKLKPEEGKDVKIK